MPTGDWTIELDLTPRKPAAAIVDQPTSPMILQIGDYNGQGSLSLWRYFSAATLTLYVRGSTEVGSWTLASAATAADFYSPTTRRKITLRKSGTAIEVWDRGTKYGPFTLTNAITSWSSGFLRLGSINSLGQHAGDTDFHELRISRVARSDAACAAYSNGTVTLTRDADTTGLWTFDGTLVPQVAAVHITDWFDSGTDGATAPGQGWPAVVAVESAPSGATITRRYRSQNTLGGSGLTAWAASPATTRGRYRQIETTFTTGVVTASPSVDRYDLTPSAATYGSAVYA
jgi:hypothetical protein